MVQKQTGTCSSNFQSYSEMVERSKKLLQLKICEQRVTNGKCPFALYAFGAVHWYEHPFLQRQLGCQLIIPCCFQNHQLLIHHFFCYNSLYPNVQKDKIIFQDG